MKKILAFSFLFIATWVNAQSIISWTEQNGTLGLGYPVPIPVDTPEPFDGFRTYSGLFSKHQSLALENPFITGHIVGQTHYERDIWAYVLSDENNLTKYGVKEGAMLINGNIHAREWQTPEVLTGIMELLDAHSNDQSLHQYLLENTTIVALPVNNVDGLLQTQRYPAQNWYSTNQGPRDGRMRRKNLLNVDENLNTMSDHLLGVDLNRNNNPYWATSTNSSSNAAHILYHGPFTQSEPETQARLTAADLVDADQVRVYTDVHSFSKVHFSVRTNITARNTLMRNLLQDFSRHHVAFPKRANYQDRPSGPGGGIGSTDEYFALTYEVPSWTLEVEPGGNGGVEYGGFGNDGHDGFILPESEITRVREQLAETFMVAWYGQAGPPSVTQFRIVEKEVGTIVYDARWDIQDDGTRQLLVNEIDNIIAGKEYSLIIGFDKPMRVRDVDDQVVHLQGQNSFDLNPLISTSIAGNSIELEFSNAQWLNQKSNNLKSYHFYKDDTYTVDVIIPDSINLDNSEILWSINVADMVGQKLDANPATVTTWASGQWQNYEDDSNENSLFGGSDGSYSVQIDVLSEHEFIPAVQASGLYFDPMRSGEGFSYELLTEDRVWIQWFTYDTQGNQRWYTGLGEFSANRISLNEMLETSGGVFGGDFNAGNIEYSTFGSLEIIFNGGIALNPPVAFHTVTRTAKVLYTDLQGKKLSTNMHQLSLVKGAVNTAEPVNTIVPIPEPVGLITGSWFDSQRSGEGYVIEILEDNRAVLLVYTYDLAGNHLWLIDSGGVITANLNEISIDFTHTFMTEGGIFGEDFNTDDINQIPWGEFHFNLNCLGTGTVSYASIITGFGSAQYNVTKLTTPLLVPFVCD